MDFRDQRFVATIDGPSSAFRGALARAVKEFEREDVFLEVEEDGPGELRLGFDFRDFPEVMSWLMGELKEHKARVVPESTESSEIWLTPRERR